MDTIDRQIIGHLQGDGRMSFADLGRLIGLSPPATAERVRRLEDQGVISGTRAMVNPSAIGLQILAFITLKTSGEHYQKVHQLSRDLDQVLECHHVAGPDSFIIKAVVATVADLEALIAEFRPYGHTETSIVLSTAAERKPYVPPKNGGISRK